jgi:ABC-type lipoprotein release transport system permease subunit
MLVTVAWRNLWRHRRRTLLTAVAMAVGIALCMASAAFTDGTFATLFDVLVEQQLGHVQVHHPSYPKTRDVNDTLPDADALLARIDAHPGVRAAAGRLSGFALVGGETGTAGALLVGVDPARERAITPFHERVREGRFLADSPAQEIVLGHELAAEIGAKLGDSVVVVTQSSDGSLGNVLLTVVGTAKTGNAQIDRAGALVHVADLRDLLVLPDQLHEVLVLTDDPDTIADTATALRQEIGSDTVEVVPWWEASPQTASMMNLRDTSTAIVIGVVFGAAAFGVLNTMMMSVFERTRELGVLRALGMRPRRLVALILVESGGLAILASLIGVALGLLLDVYLVRSGIDLSGSLEKGYEFSGVVLDPIVKGVVRVEPIVTIVVAVFVVTFGASLWPAWRAARLRPVEAIRSE